MGFMQNFITLGRFDIFVSDVIRKKKKQEEDKIKEEDDLKLWIAWCHSGSEESYGSWVSKLYTGRQSQKQLKGDESLTEHQIINIVNQTFCG